MQRIGDFVRFVSYAQNFEDVLLWRALGHVEAGCYIDIGAHSPIVDSVSQGFYEKGWRGFHVEPTERYASQLRQQRPDETVFQVALGATEGTVDFFEIDDTGLSTTLASIADKHVGDGWHAVRRIVPQQTLDHLLDSMSRPDVHWLKIDVEGAEASVLQGWRHSNVRPWILVIEATQPGTAISVQHEWEHLVLAKGYTRVYFDGLNCFFISNEHPELAAAFSVPVNVFDDFELSGHSSSPLSQRLGRQLTELREYAHHLEVHRAALLNSRSWRVTLPLRRLWDLAWPALHMARLTLDKLFSAAERVVRQVLLWAIRLVLRRPFLASLARKCLVKVPALERQLLSVAVRGGVVPGMFVESHARTLVSNPSNESLTGWARCLHRRMQAHRTFENESGPR